MNYTQITDSQRLTPYEEIERRFDSKNHNRRCIDGKITGCNKCVGYCQYDGHPGYLNENLRRTHDCLGKQCFYYIEKSKSRFSSENNKCINKKIPERLTILETVKNTYSDLEGIKFLESAPSKDGYIISYVTLSNVYPIQNMQRDITLSTGRNIVLKKLNYDFDKIVNIIMS